MVEYVEHFLSDQRLQSAYLGQGVIGTFASPHDPGTASIHFHHQSGRQGGIPGMWGYVAGWNGHGVVHPLRHRPRRRRGRLDGRPGRPHHPRGRRRARGRRANQGIVRRLERRPARHARPAGRRSRPRLARPRARGSADRLHRQAEYRARRSCPASRPARERSMPHHLGQINTPLSKAGVAVRLRSGAAPAACPSGSGASSIFRPRTTRAWRPPACTR